jgi:hypothetical protein
VEDYGWALAGRNTIDLYMPNQREMNDWGVRQEAIEIVKWGDPQESAIPPTASGLQTHQTHGARARRPPKRSGRIAITTHAFEQ